MEREAWSSREQLARGVEDALARYSALHVSFSALFPLPFF